MASFGNWLRNTAGSAIGGVGHALGLPELGVSEAVQDPRRSIFTASPNNLSTLSNSPQLYPGMPGYGQPTGQADGGVLGAWTMAQGGGAGGGGGGASAYDPNTDPNLVAQARGQVQGLTPQLNDLYNQINSGIDQYAQDRRGSLDQSYNQQFANDAQNFATTNDKTNGYYTANNSFDSSARGNALQGNQNAYDQNVQAMNQARDQNYADIGSFVAKNKAAIANKPQYDLSQYNDVNSLLSLRDQLNSHIQGLQGQKTNLLTNGQLKSQLDSVAPAQSQLATTLKSRLDSLMQSDAPDEAKYGLAQGYINQAGLPNDQKDKWNNYYTSLLGGSKKTPATV